MVWPVIGAIAGGLLSMASASKTAKKNARSVKNANDANAQEAERGRQFARQQVLDARVFDKKQVDLAYSRNRAGVVDARAYDRKQVLESRTYGEKQQLAAEARERRYLAQDREYASPAATRARLEAAGINPAVGVDASTGFASTQAQSPGSLSPAASSIAEAQAAVSGVASPVTATFQAAIEQPMDIGSHVANAFAAYGDHLLQQKEIALRETQIAQENQRLNELMQRASMRPVVPGVYGASPYRAGVSSAPRSSSVAGSPGASGSRVPPKTEAYGLYVDVYDQQTQRWITIPNPDLMDAGPMEMATGLGTIGAADAAQNGVPSALSTFGDVFSKPAVNKPQRIVIDTPSWVSAGNPWAARPSYKPARSAYGGSGNNPWAAQAARQRSTLGFQ